MVDVEDLDDVKDFEIDIDEEEMEPEEPTPEDIKRKLNVIEDELENISSVQWVYAKRLLKYGIAAWIFGIAAFAVTMAIFWGPGVIFDASPLIYSLLIIAGAAPILVSVVFIRRFREKSNRLEGLRDNLLNNYEAALLDKVEDKISE